MKNRAKCKLCQSIIESFHSTDYVMCKCGEISVDGGEALRCSARNFNNFLRIDDEGNEIVVKVMEKDEVMDSIDTIKESLPTIERKELLDMLDESIKYYDKLPQDAMLAPVTHADMVSLMVLLREIFKSYPS